MNNHIPEQHEGSQMDIHAQTKVDDLHEARDFYKKVKIRLLEAFRWHEVCKVPVSTFMLTDSAGNEVHRALQQGDHLKIDIPGPGTSTGEGYDWVVVEEVFEESTGDTELLSVTVRPAPNPKSGQTDVAHFFKDAATSTFQVKRIAHEIHAEVHGRNEQANTETDNTVDNIRNTLVGVSARLGLSFPQWKSLVTGLVEKENS